MSTGNHAAAQATLERAELRKTENDDRDPEQEPKAWYHLLQQWLSGDDEDLKKIAEKHIKGIEDTRKERENHKTQYADRIMFLGPRLQALGYQGPVVTEYNQMLQGISPPPGGYRPAPMSTGNHAAAQARIGTAKASATPEVDPERALMQEQASSALEAFHSKITNERNHEKKVEYWHDQLQQWLIGDNEELKNYAKECKHLMIPLLQNNKQKEALAELRELNDKMENDKARDRLEQYQETQHQRWHHEVQKDQKNWLKEAEELRQRRQVVVESGENSRKRTEELKRVTDTLEKSIQDLIDRRSQISKTTKAPQQELTGQLEVIEKLRQQVNPLDKRNEEETVFTKDLTDTPSDKTPYTLTQPADIESAKSPDPSKTAPEYSTEEIPLRQGKTESLYREVMKPSNSSTTRITTQQQVVNIGRVNKTYLLGDKARRPIRIRGRFATGQGRKPRPTSFSSIRRISRGQVLRGRVFRTQGGPSHRGRTQYLRVSHFRGRRKIVGITQNKIKRRAIKSLYGRKKVLIISTPNRKRV